MSARLKMKLRMIIAHMQLRIAFLSHNEFDTLKNLRPSNFRIGEVFYLQITVNQFLDAWANESHFRPAIEKKWAMPTKE